MAWTDELLKRLESQPCSYDARGDAASEPTALASWALALWDRRDAAQRAARWLLALQSEDGSVGVRAGETTPCWPTALACLAWNALLPKLSESKPVSWRADLDEAAQQAVAWLLEMRSHSLPRNPVMGHNTLLVGWPWVRGTHAWVEPTSWSVAALKTRGYAAHPRTREGVELLWDRQLPKGGWNYGNTTVLGSELRPHLQATGIALTALAGEPDAVAQASQSLVYLQRQLSGTVPTLSLCWSLLGLAAHGRYPADATAWLEQAAKRTLAQGASPLKLALLLLAARAREVQWIGPEQVPAVERFAQSNVAAGG